jgi:hypothetical protein
MCSAMANFGKPPRKVFVIQLEEVKAEWRRRHPKSVTDAKVIKIETILQPRPS